LKKSKLENGKLLLWFLNTQNRNIMREKNEVKMMIFLHRIGRILLGVFFFFFSFFYGYFIVDNV